MSRREFSRPIHGSPHHVAMTLALLLLAVFPRLSAARTDFIYTNSFKLSAATGRTGELWVAAATADLDSRTSDDCICLTQTTRLAGVVRGNFVSLSQEIILTGRVERNTRLLSAKTIACNGLIGGNLAAAAAAGVHLQANSTIRGDALLLGNNVITEGSIGGRTFIMAQAATLGGRFAGNVRVVADDIVVMPGTTVNGNLVYTTQDDKQVFLPTNAVVTGHLVKKSLPRRPAESSSGGIPLVRNLIFLCGAFITGFIWIAVMPAVVGRVVYTLYRAPWWSLVSGLVAFAFLPIVITVSAATVVGIPFAVMVLSTYAVSLYLGKIAVALLLGLLILRRKTSVRLGARLAALAIGLLLLYVAAAWPPITLMVWMAATVYGMGAILVALVVPGAPPRPPLSQSEHGTSQAQPPFPVSTTEESENKEEK